MISLTYFFQFNRDIDHIYHSKNNFQVLLYLCHNDLAFFINNLIRNHKMYYTEFPTTTPSTSKRPLSSVPIADSAFIQGILYFYYSPFECPKVEFPPFLLH